MNFSKLLEQIIEDAEHLRVSYEAKNLSAGFIIAAASRYYFSKLINTDFSIYPEYFEEERLKYVYKNTMRISDLSKIYARKVSHLADIPFDFSKSEQIAAARGKSILTADIVFLSALADFPVEKRICLPKFRTDFSITEILEEADKNIYDYVIEQAEEAIKKIQLKADYAKILRDRKAARKFLEPQELQQMFFGSFKTEFKDDILHITFPFFFGDTELKISIYTAEDIYIVTDNGATLKLLREKVETKEKFDEILSKVCDEQWIQNDEIIGNFSQSHGFYYYLCRLIFIANADAFYTRLENCIYPENDSYEHIGIDKREAFEPSFLINEFKETMSFSYDEDEGLRIGLGMLYSINCTNAAFLIETNEDGSITLSDGRKGKVEGEILESFYWDNDDIYKYEKLVKDLTEKFGVYLTEGNIYIDGPCEKFVEIWFKFINAAVLLSELGAKISLN